MKLFHQPEHFIRFYVIACVALFAACSEDQEPQLPHSIAEFSEQSISMIENEDERVLSVVLDKAAPADGQIELAIITSNITCFNTAPASSNGKLVLDILAGQKQVDFKLTPNDNKKRDGTKTVQFTIAKTPAYMSAGLSRKVDISVHDDEAPAAANMPLEAIMLRENDANGSSITVHFAAEAPEDGTLVFKLQTGAKYGVDYITEPAPISSKIFLSVHAGQRSASFKLMSVNDNAYRSDRRVSVSLIEAVGGVTLGDVIELDCIITEDDGQQLSAISAVRALFDNTEEVIIQGDVYVDAVVTSIDNVMPGRIVIQDYSGALPVQLSVNTKLTRGDHVIANLHFGRLHTVQGVLEVAQVSIIDKVDEAAVDTRQLSLEELFGSGLDIQSTTIQLSGLAFLQADGLTKMLGDRIATDGVRNVVIRTNTFASFREELVPNGVLAITGILTKVNGQFILYPQDFDDIRHQSILPNLPHPPVKEPVGSVPMEDF